MVEKESLLFNTDKESMLTAFFSFVKSESDSFDLYSLNWESLFTSCFSEKYPEDELSVQRDRLDRLKVYEKE